MNILVVTSEIGADGGGMAISCQRLVSILSEEHEVKVLSSLDYPIETAAGGYSEMVADGIRREYKLKSDALTHQNADIIIGFGGRFNGYYASLLAEKLGKRYILVLRGSDTNIVKWSAEEAWLLKEMCSKSNQIVCLSKEMIQNILSVVPSVKRKISIIPNELETDFKEVVFPHLPHSVLLGCAAAHINEKKGISNIFDMMYEFRKISDIPLELDIVGDIDDDLQDEYKDKCKRLGIEDAVHFKGYQSRDELKETASDWDFYIQASVCEGHPNAITEALQVGTGFISSRTGFVAESLQDQFSELFFRNWRSLEMAKDLLHLIGLDNKPVLYQGAYKKLSSLCERPVVYGLWKKLVSAKETQLEDIAFDNIVAVGLHDIQGDIHDSITTPVNVFRMFVEYVHSCGHGLCSMREYLNKTPEERRKWIVCTFDDGYKSLVDNAMGILANYGFTATVFVCTGLIGKDNTWNNKDAHLREHLDINDIQKLSEGGWEIASHGVMHRNLLKLSDLEIEYELKESQRFLQELVGYSVTYAYPYGAYNKFISSCVKKYYQYAFAVDTGGTSLSADSLQIRRYSITEIYKMLKK